MRPISFLAVAILLLAGPPDPTAAQDVQVTTRQADFFRLLMIGGYEGAYRQLLYNSPILTDETDRLNALIADTQRAIEAKGGMTEWENHTASYEDAHLTYGIATACCAKGPLFFYFVWYRNNSIASWFVAQVWFNDDAREFLDRFPLGTP